MATTTNPGLSRPNNNGGLEPHPDFDDVIWMRAPGVVHAGLGDDTVHGSGGSDIILGELGDDTLFGNAGQDYLYGGSGDDEIFGGAGDDALFGGHGADFLDGGTGNDTASYAGSSSGVSVNLATGAASGGAANGDTFAFTYIPYTLQGVNTIENLVGSDFNDTLHGDHRANVLVGGAGNDTIFGQGGTDVLEGGAGDDELRGGGQNDIVCGGTGEDIFVLDPGMTIIKDFVPGEDQVGIEILVPAVVGDHAEIQYAFNNDYIRYVSDGAGNTLIQYDTNGDDGGANWQTAAVLEGIAPEQLNKNDFTI